MICITPDDGKSTTAKVVDEYDLRNGCDAEHAGQQPCRNNVVDGSAAVWNALGLNTDVGEAGESNGVNFTPFNAILERVEFHPLDAFFPRARHSSPSFPPSARSSSSLSHQRPLPPSPLHSSVGQKDSETARHSCRSFPSVNLCPVSLSISLTAY
ncbi:hypothetical protein EJ110_NYTH37136 [Nymphaea thermarum]|nr:hypothetical protein EJ110_NYTH37136 [Nymphaea thermarum]